MLENNRNGSVVIFVLVLIAAVIIVTHSALRSVHRSGRLLGSLAGREAARETAGAGLEYAKAEVYRRHISGDELPAEGIEFEGVNWSASARPSDNAGEYKLTGSGRYGREKETVSIILKLNE